MSRFNLNKSWLKWIEQNKAQIEYLADVFPDIMEATEVEETSLDIDEYCDLIDSMIISFRFPEWKKILNYMRYPDTYDEKMETFLVQLDENLDREGLSDMESILAEQMYDQHLYTVEHFTQL